VSGDLSVCTEHSGSPKATEALRGLGAPSCLDDVVPPGPNLLLARLRGAPDILGYDPKFWNLLRTSTQMID
jgi:hypothetical protein